MADDGGVLENLPNSRPGRRSAKREKGGRPAESASAAAEKAEATGKRAAATPKTKPKAAAKPKAAKPKTYAKPKTDAPKAAAPAPEPEADPVTTVIRTAAGVATAGARVAHSVTRELLRRIPRP
jgi:hypothetical protein